MGEVKRKPLPLPDPAMRAAFVEAVRAHVARHPLARERTERTEWRVAMPQDPRPSVSE